MPRFLGDLTMRGLGCGTGSTTVTVSTAGVASATFTAEAFLQVGLGASLTVGGDHNCARADSDGSWYCWGNSLDQQIPPGPTPVLIGGVTLLGVSAGGEHACGLTVNGEACCWGLNSSGQLGDGTTPRRRG